MKSKSFYIFSTAVDMETIIRDFEQQYDVKYYKTGMFKTENFDGVSLLVLSDWAQVPNGDNVQNPSYLVMLKSSSLVTRAVPQRTGETLYAIDQLHNPNSIVFRPSGSFKNNSLIGGSVGTVNEEGDSKLLYNALCKLIKKSFKKTGSFYVGKEAESLLDNGWSLTDNVMSPKDYDLKNNNFIYRMQ